MDLCFNMNFFIFLGTKCLHFLVVLEIFCPLTWPLLKFSHAKFQFFFFIQFLVCVCVFIAFNFLFHFFEDHCSISLSKTPLFCICKASFFINLSIKVRRMTGALYTILIQVIKLVGCSQFQIELAHQQLFFILFLFFFMKDPKIVATLQNCQNLSNQEFINEHHYSGHHLHFIQSIIICIFFTFFNIYIYMHIYILCW